MSIATSTTSQHNSYVEISTGDESVAIYILLATSKRNDFSMFEAWKMKPLLEKEKILPSKALILESKNNSQHHNVDNQVVKKREQLNQAKNNITKKKHIK